MKSAEPVQYDRIAPTYDQRFSGNRRAGTADALLSLAQVLNAERVLEVGCGTGRWLGDVRAHAGQVIGLDLSAGMLSQAQERAASLLLIRGRAGSLPFPAASFDLVYCVNAIHHFGRPRLFVREARRLLRPGGRLAVVGMEPRGHAGRSYIYRHFEGAYETDLNRFPSWGEVLDWIVDEGFEGVECRQVERILERKIGREVLDDPYLRRDACSQLALLADEAYVAGLRRIEAVVRQAESAGERAVFVTDIPIAMLTGQVPEEGE